VELWATKGAAKKEFLIHSTQIGTGAFPVPYSIADRGSYPEGKVAGM